MLLFPPSSFSPSSPLPPPLPSLTDWHTASLCCEAFSAAAAVLLFPLLAQLPFLEGLGELIALDTVAKDCLADVAAVVGVAVVGVVVAVGVVAAVGVVVVIIIVGVVFDADGVDGNVDDDDDVEAWIAWNIDSRSFSLNQISCTSTSTSKSASRVGMSLVTSYSSKCWRVLKGVIQ